MGDLIILFLSFRPPFSVALQLISKRDLTDDIEQADYAFVGCVTLNQSISRESGTVSSLGISKPFEASWTRMQ